MRYDDQLLQSLIKFQCTKIALKISYDDDDKYFYTVFWLVGIKKISLVPWRNKLRMI